MWTTKARFVTDCTTCPHPIPASQANSLGRYIESGISPGGFLQAVIKNNLRGAASLADLENRNLLFNYVYCMHNFTPAGCWGGDEKYKEWVDYILSTKG